MTCRAIVFFGLFDGVDLARMPLRRPLLEVNAVFRCKKHSSSAWREQLGMLTGSNHLVALGQVHGHWLFDDDVFAGLRGLARDGAMQVVRKSEYDQLEVLDVEQGPKIDVMPGNSPLVRKAVGRLACPHTRGCCRVCVTGL